MTNITEAHPRRRAYGEDLRRLAVTAVLEDGMSLAAAGRRFGVSEISVASWVRRWRERGHLRADARGGDRKSWRIEAERERIFRILERQPALTVRALRDRLGRRGPRVRDLHRAALPEAPRPEARTPPQRPPRRPPPQTRGRPARMTAGRGAAGRSFISSDYGRTRTGRRLLPALRREGGRRGPGSRRRMLAQPALEKLVSELAGRPATRRVRDLLYRLLVEGLGAESKVYRLRETGAGIAGPYPPPALAKAGVAPDPIGAHP